MPAITVHVSDVENVVAIEWPDRSGVMVVDRDGHVVHRNVVPPFAEQVHPEEKQ